MGDREERQDLLVRDAAPPGAGSDDEDDLEASGGGAALPPGREAVEVALLSLLLAVSSAAAVVLLPVYLETVSAVGDAYTALLFATLGSSTLLLGAAWAGGGVRVSRGYGALSTDGRPLGQRWLVWLRDGSLLALAGFLVLTALQEQRVPCHAQDPLQGLVLVAAIVHYFFFSHRAVSLRQLFLSTGAAVGLFVACDYALCDGYRCRGWEREAAEGPAMGRGLRAAWLVAYLAGLAAWALVAGALSEGGAVAATPGSALLHTARVHAAGLPLTLLLLVTELAPGIAGATVNAGSSLLATQWAGLGAHFSNGAVAGTAWSWLLAYCCVAACCTLLLRRLRLSSVLALGAACAGLPLASLWWALFRLRHDGRPPLGFGLVEWKPNLATGEAISAFLGLPLVVGSVALALRTHLRGRKGASPSAGCSRDAGSPGAAAGTVRLCSPDSSS